MEDMILLIIYLKKVLILTREIIKKFRFVMLNYTPLHYACQKRSIETIRILLNNGAEGYLENEKILIFILMGL